MKEVAIFNELKTWLTSSSKIDQQIYNDYLASAKFIQNTENDFTIVVNSSFGVKMVEPLLPLINEKIKSFKGHNILINVISEDEYKKHVKWNNKPVKTANLTNESSFANFVIGASNKQAYKAAKAVIENPGKFNPLFIYGDSGLGKTHLLKAIKQDLGDNHKELNCVYVNSDDFGRKVVDVIHQGHEAIETFKNQYINADVLLIDDIQFLAKKEKTNEILFTIFNNYIENGKQLVFSSDKIPDELNGFDARLITRFNLGLTTPLNVLDFETAYLIVEAELMAKNLHTKIDKSAKEYIAKNLANDVRKIKGSVTKISFWLSMNDDIEIIDMKAINDLFKDIPTSNLGILNVKKIKEIVGEKYGVSIKLIDGKARTANIANARHVAMFLTKDVLDHSLSQIGIEFGGKDHTTVMSAINKISKSMTKDKEFKKIIEILKNKILSK